MKNIFKKIAVLIPLVLATTFASASPCGIFGSESEIVQAKAVPLQAYECGSKSYINYPSLKVLIVTDKSDWDDVNEEQFELISQWLGLKSQMLTPSILIIDYSKANVDHLRAMNQATSSLASPKERDEVILTLAKAGLSNKKKEGEIK